MRLIFGILIIGFVAGAAYLSLNLTGFAQWAADAQRGFQNLMAGAIRGLKSGDPGALLALFGAAGAYGFVHALGPGHGKYLVGGVGLGTNVDAARLVGIAVASSLAQSLWAIILVYGGFFLISASAAQMTFLAEDILAPASYLLIGAVGAVLVWRGLRALPLRARATAHANAHHGHPHDHTHGDDCGCGHSHGPTPEEVAKLSSWRETLALIGSIAVRPCTGAIFLLVIAWQIGIPLAGAAAVIVMGLGTAALTTTVALSSIFARRAALFSATPTLGSQAALSSVQIAAGCLIMALSFALFSLRV